MHPCRVGDIRWPGQKRRAVGHKRQHVINSRLRVLPTWPEWLRLSCRARDTAATMLHHSRHRGESVTKTIKFFVAHTVNYVICNNHTRIDRVLLNFTPVIQQNYHQLGRKFENFYCAVDRLSCQLELSKSETSQFRSDLVFVIVNSFMGAKCCFEIFNEFRLLCCLNFMGQECAGIVPESSRGWQHFMQCLHQLRRYFVPLPWRFLTQPEIQQGSDRLNIIRNTF